MLLTTRDPANSPNIEFCHATGNVGQAYNLICLSIFTSELGGWGGGDKSDGEDGGDGEIVVAVTDR